MFFKLLTPEFVKNSKETFGERISSHHRLWEFILTKTNDNKNSN